MMDFSPPISGNNFGQNLELWILLQEGKRVTDLPQQQMLLGSQLTSSLLSLHSAQHRRLDRSVSEPPRLLHSSSRYKTELCRPFEENGVCKYGDKCQFAHGMAEMRSMTRHPKYKTELCRTFHSTGFCPYGPRCHFIHNSVSSHKSDDLCSISIGSAGELSPLSSSSGSPTNSFFNFNDDSGPLTAPPVVSGGRFFGQDFIQSLCQEFSPKDVQSLCQEFSPKDDHHDDEPAMDIMKNGRPALSAAINIHRAVTRLPIFSSIAYGSP